MADGDQDLRERWLHLIRRSLGLPDIMTYTSARAIIEGRIASAFEGEDNRTDSAWDIARALLDAALDLGAAGVIDDCLVTDPAMVEDLKDADIGLQPLGERIVSQSQVGGAATTKQRAARAIETVLGSVAPYAKNHPDL